MTMPRRVVAVLALGGFGAAVVLAALLSDALSSGATPRSPSAVDEGPTVRWGNVTLQIAEDSGITAARTTAQPELNPPDGGLVLLLHKGNSLMVLDADDGRPIHDTVEDEDRAFYEQLLTTMVVGDPGQAGTGWPYIEARPDVGGRQYGNVWLTPPDPTSGIVVSEWTSYGSASGAIEISNGRSRLIIDAGTGRVVEETTQIAPEDRAAFDRLLSTVQH
jgi:hypothetical protein